MSLTPDYGETLLPHDELDALLPIARSLFSEPIAKAAVYDLEQGFEIAVKERYLTAVLEGELSVDELLDDYFVRRLHGELYGDIWSWAGAYRKIEVNIGIAPEQIAVELRSSLHTLLTSLLQRASAGHTERTETIAIAYRPWSPIPEPVTPPG